MISACFCRSFLPLAVVLLLLVTASAGQSGRSWMKGIVFDESDVHGISGALIELVGDRSNERLRSVHLQTRADERGKYSFAGIPYGDYTFRASAAGFVTYEIQLYVASDALTELHVKLRKKTP